MSAADQGQGRDLGLHRIRQLGGGPDDRGQVGPHRALAEVGGQVAGLPRPERGKPSRSNVFLDVIPYIRAVPVMETWVDIENTVGKELERGVYGEATVDEVIETATRRTLEYFPQ